MNFMYLPSKSLLFREYPRGFHTSCEAFIKSAFLAIFSGFQINHANPAFPANVLFRILVLKKIKSKINFFFFKNFHFWLMKCLKGEISIFSVPVSISWKMHGN